MDAKECASFDVVDDRTEIVPIDALSVSDSPRINGRNEEHAHVLAGIGDELPAIVVHRQTMRVIDGAHRLKAAVLRGERTIKVRYFDGTADDAFVLAVKMNVSHGLPLSLADRKAAAERIFESHPHWSDRAIASAVGLAAGTVAAMRRELAHEVLPVTTRIGRDGRTRPVDGAASRERAADILAGKPDATLREISEGAGVSLNTARDVRNRVHRGDDPLLPTQRRARLTESRPDDAFDLEALLKVLRQDPILRFSEKGRVLLRLLDSHAVVARSWPELIDTVPSHWVEAVAEVANDCSQAWRQFAEHVRNRRPDLVRKVPRG
ncbi:ParB/RepB/Spo0J family partition protein [Kibdelosporangium persicum]|uniref:Streptomycin biosynthesis operon regulator n=1 Tax=Kibdelosporangium persicum TaxID=2698649 RepID=A0ABX2F1F4_9PSEU|nr:ParB/RepB/Spo0J family partition protein [Kibdelosporangium persicum]NRN64708.1 Streptomycin biosynthesis operon regulator [Kibdelosporangium persicum]